MNQVPKPIKKLQTDEVVFFNKLKPKLVSNTIKPQVNNSKNEQETISLKQAKFDVFNFGIKGLSKENQDNAKLQLAIKLGAKPLKKSCINYKELLNSKKEESKKKNQIGIQSLTKEKNVFRTKRITKNGIQKAKINRGHVGNIKGQIGSFSNGILKIKKHDIKNFSSK